MNRLPIFTAQGAPMPYLLAVQDRRSQHDVEMAVLDKQHDTVIATGTFEWNAIPVTEGHPDIAEGSILLGHTDALDRMLIEFGQEDTRLGLVPAAAMRRALRLS